jgi:hypothetical protein
MCNLLAKNVSGFSPLIAVSSTEKTTYQTQAESVEKVRLHRVILRSEKVTSASFSSAQTSRKFLHSRMGIFAKETLIYKWMT